MDLIDDKAEKPILVYSCGLRSRLCLYGCYSLQAVDRKHVPFHVYWKATIWSMVLEAPPWWLYLISISSQVYLLNLPGGGFHSLIAGIQQERKFQQKQNTPQPQMWPIKEARGGYPLPLPCKGDEKGFSTKLEWCWAWKSARCGWMGELLSSLQFVCWDRSQPCQGCSWGPSS